jgi:hypothetical protein
MIYAINDKGKRIKCNSKGLTALCPTCNEIVISRYGEVNRPHWAHKKNDCDSWFEPISDWHINWQNKFPEKNQEITLSDYNGKKHRADIKLDNGLVIEMQNSPIKISEIEQREKFYSKDGGLLWVLNGSELTKHCNLSIFVIPSNYYFNIILMFFNDNNGYDEYEYEILEKELENTRTIKKLRENKYYVDEFKNLLGHKFTFSTELNFELINSYLLEDIRTICKKNNFYYDYILSKLEVEFNVKHKVKLYDFHVKHWRKFIDEMKSPVFIDNLIGIKKDELYWLQKNKIIKKNKFLAKYLKYT